MVTTQDAHRWLERWDRQQEHYIADREERFAVIADVVVAAVERPDPLIVDLGAGPGSLSVRLLDRIPAATVVAVDADPLLLGLARAAYSDRPGLRIVDHDLRDPGWVEALELPRRPDAFAATTALHWLTRDQLAEVYRFCATALAPEGILVNGDHFQESPDIRPQIGALLAHVARGRAARVGLPGREDWGSWWEAVATAPELADIRGDQGGQPIQHDVPETPSLDGHLDLLHSAGFTESGTVWQHGDDRVLVAVH
ncbi:MAG: class I SAM-dependent methyltransferase [Pseudonocardia sp.]|nr:class I SAM-dependent methyltransferase [Actinomycetes bacterium]MDN5934421.1 class I SAM-dependent methyltransferase [Pseudonocardia sp.]